MSVARVHTGLWARALLRRILATGRSAMVLSKGDEERGSVLVVARTRQGETCIVREGTDMDGTTTWTREPMADAAAVDDYVTRQRRYDPDLWVLELEVEFIEDRFDWLGGRSGS
ncbi:DUF1491 family protein [Tanticharoenia sakaeratensis]|uniref:DUF1491 family protein n=1 Tax=Tanticharoenia sakaeratensis NBRC 103193 TaxID=1231623 RepID=A0A0D6MIM8_9PROT|nr:DUF1491 family protein [Tanticharoenia sakaeratensis]GAN53482.1 hypothetical protein Tasa_010_029 [Tanticharoenia sakaeratensis NBRC 103193]GBQ17750.1 hypothetical protein AA103193_0458 [Tanticharoenia sakaeratensis NBRC 103193]